MEKRIARQERILDRQLEWIRASDSKIPPLAILNAAMLGALVALAPQFGCWTSVVWMVFGIYLGLSAISLMLLIFSVIPRMGGSKSSVIYFDSVRRVSLRSYRRQVRRLTDEDYFSDLIEQSYRNAKIAGVKFRRMRTAMALWIIAAIPWALTIYLFLNVKGCGGLEVSSPL